ncbi:hypothetical protein [Pseudomonas sp. MWU12-2345]|uniref:hypothetical protein n=1 Tax=Pseudomonas sp. MWU12-2345 TaxID=2928689 RepID=UPI00201097F7|nr:hypothetical protein [Pseudomonas sp. MWU12-2345]
MAYEIHILRANEITLEEWQSFCARDRAIKLETEISGINPRTSESISISGKGSAIWTTPQTQQKYLFDFRRGRISFVYSDAALVKGKEIATALAASVEGDEGEIY